LLIWKNNNPLALMLSQADLNLLHILQQTSVKVMQIYWWRYRMARKQAQERLNEIYRTVETYPGERSGLIARILGLSRSSVTRALPALEEEGYLLSEDDDGRLWPFRRKIR
jgi:DNA-binding MarR family transcriptional regulator